MRDSGFGIRDSGFGVFTESKNKLDEFSKFVDNRRSRIEHFENPLAFPMHATLASFFPSRAQITRARDRVLG